MELQKLIYFVAVAEAKNFTTAAKNNFISQPTLSKHINELEYELGIPLFMRSKHSVYLTPEGNTLLPYAKEIVTKADNLRNLASSLAKKESGFLCVGYSGYWEFNYLCELIRQFSIAYPHINFTFIREHHGHLFRRLQHGECDLIFALKENSPTNLGNKIGWKSIANTTFSVVMSSQHPLASRKSIRLEELADETLILLDHSQDSLLNAIVSQKFQNTNPFPNYLTYMPKNSYDLSLLVLANKGLAITSRWLELSNIDGLSFVEIEDSMPAAEFGAAYRNDKISPMLRAFLEKIDEIPFNQV